MRKIISLNGEVSPENLIQLIAEAKNAEPKSIYSNEQNVLFKKRHRVCELLNSIDFTIESYGIINFFVEYSDQIADLEELGLLLEEFEHIEPSTAIKTALSFYKSNKDRFNHLESDPDDFDIVYNSLESEFRSLSEDGNFHIPLDQSINGLAEYIQSNHTEFFSISNS